MLVPKHFRFFFFFLIGLRMKFSFAGSIFCEPSLGFTIKRVKLKHYNVFVNKLMSIMRLDSSIGNIMFYMHKGIEIYFYRLEI